MAKKKIELEDAIDAAVATTTEETGMVKVVPTNSTCIPGLTVDMLGAPPYIKAPKGGTAGKKAGSIVFDKDEQVLIEYPDTARMIIQTSGGITAVSYDMVKVDKGWRPRDKWDSMEAAKAAGEQIEWIGKEGPTAVPTCELLVLIEHPSGTIDFDGSTWVRGIMCCTRKKAVSDFMVVQNLGKKWAAASRLPGREFWMLEWELGLTAPDKNNNHYLTSTLKKVHEPDSDYAKEYIANVM